MHWVHVEQPTGTATSWYEYKDAAPGPHELYKQKHDRKAFDESVDKVCKAVRREIKRTGSLGNVFILSYSQGGTIAMAALVQLKRNIGGLFLSRTTVMDRTLRLASEPNNTPIFVTVATKANKVYTPIENKSILDAIQRKGWNVRLVKIAIIHFEDCKFEVDIISKTLLTLMNSAIFKGYAGEPALEEAEYAWRVSFDVKSVKC